MLWKFGFHDTSAIDALLDKGEVSLEAILDEDDLLQECKSQNTRLMDYFQRADVLQRLFGYVSGNIEGEGQGRIKYPYVATEVLCSELWCIVETCLSHPADLLSPFWDIVLDRDPEDMKPQSVLASHFTKINATFLNKKPAEMLAFIRAQPGVVERLLAHIETPAIVDLLVRIVQLDGIPECAGVLEWLSAERLMPRLVDLLSPHHTESMHATVSELVKGIISMSAPSPGAGITDGLQNGPASNLFARQLAKRENIERLVGYMLNDFTVEPDVSPRKKTNGSMVKNPSSPPSSPNPKPELATLIPDVDNAISSGTHAISIIIELIRKNNSDYFEPYLFHTLRNRLIQVQQHMHAQREEGREALEHAFNEMIDRMAVVHFGPMLEVMCERMENFQQLLRKPRSSCEPIATTLGSLTPLTFERFRICELYAELLHCSNMSLLNRPPALDNLYDSEGRLQGGLSALEDLARVIAIGAGTDEQGNMEDDVDEMEPAQELPVSGASTDMSMLDYSDDDEDMSGSGGHSSGDDAMEEIDMNDSQLATPPPVSPREDDAVEYPPLVVPSSPNAASLASPTEIANQGATLARTRRASSRTGSDRSSIRSRGASVGSRRSLKRSVIELSGHIPIGDKLKQCFTDTKVLPSLLDLFFSFPWNNFLHSVVYDLLHQILTGRVDRGRNRELTVALFRDGLLLHRIVDAQKRNDAESTKPGHVRLGYMGHLTLISEDVIGALEHYPPDLRIILAKYAPQPDWDDYVGGRYHETKVKDTCLLGGGKPVVASGMTRTAKWKVDEAEMSPSPGNAPAANGFDSSATAVDPSATMKGEFRRTNRLTRESSADFGIAPFEQDTGEDATGPPQFASYLAREISPHVTSDDGSDDDDDEGGWLSQRVDFAEPPVSVRSRMLNRRPLDPGAFDDAFTPSAFATAASDTVTNGFSDNFSFDDDQFGPFSDAAAVPSDGDQFSFTSISVSDDDPSFEDFGGFGDFQSGELTPTGGSWMFASDTSVSSASSEEPEVIEADRSTMASSSNSPEHFRTEV